MSDSSETNVKIPLTQVRLEIHSTNPVNTIQGLISTITLSGTISTEADNVTRLHVALHIVIRGFLII